MYNLKGIVSIPKSLPKIGIIPDVVVKQKPQMKKKNVTKSTGYGCFTKASYLIF